jgi:hypothetical protein
MRIAVFGQSGRLHGRMLNLHIQTKLALPVLSRLMRARNHVNQDAHRRAAAGKFDFQSGPPWIKTRAPCSL